MNNLSVMVSGELQRMKKYNILTASFFVALIWVAVLHFLDSALVSTLFPTLLFIDAVSMPILLVGVVMFFERQEGSLKAMLVAPVSHGEYIWSKIVVGVFSGLLTLLILYLYAYFARGFTANVFLLVVAIGLMTSFHSLLGFLASYVSPDFTGLLMRTMGYFFAFMLPVFLEQVGLITNVWVTRLLYIMPTKAGVTLLNNATATSSLQTGEVVYAVGYFLVAGALLYRLVVSRFAEFAQKESGV